MASGTGVEVQVGVGVAAAVVVFALMSALAETCAGVGSGVGGTDDPPKQPRVIAVNPTTKIKGMYSGFLGIRLSPFSDAISYERIRDNGLETLEEGIE